MPSAYNIAGSLAMYVRHMIATKATILILCSCITISVVHFVHFHLSWNRLATAVMSHLKKVSTICVFHQCCWHLLTSMNTRLLQLAIMKAKYISCIFYVTWHNPGKVNYAIAVRNTTISRSIDLTGLQHRECVMLYFHMVSYLDTIITMWISATQCLGVAVYRTGYDVDASWDSLNNLYQHDGCRCPLREVRAMSPTTIMMTRMWQRCRTEWSAIGWYLYYECCFI